MLILMPLNILQNIFAFSHNKHELLNINILCLLFFFASTSTVSSGGVKLLAFPVLCILLSESLILLLLVLVLMLPLLPGTSEADIGCNNKKAHIYKCTLGSANQTKWRIFVN